VFALFAVQVVLFQVCLEGVGAIAPRDGLSLNYECLKFLVSGVAISFPVSGPDG
jgi:hypothetical protein